MTTVFSNQTKHVYEVAESRSGMFRITSSRFYIDLPLDVAHGIADAIVDLAESADARNN